PEPTRNCLSFLAWSATIMVLALALGCSANLDEHTETVEESGTPDTVEQGLLSEFEGSFPEKASPNGEVVDFEFVAAPAEVKLFPEFKTKVWAYDGRVPGPTLRIRLGQTLRLKFTNALPQPTTIHWHGVRVPHAMDGVPGVTQAPIEPGEIFVYEFTPKDPGTYWFHPHVRGAEQLERGLYGALIVEDAKPAPYSRDLVWILDDWRLMEDAQIYDKFVTGGDISHDGRWGNVPTVNGRVQPTIAFNPGERIRLRLINSANARIFRPDFTALKATGIAFDGMTASRPFDPAGYDLAPGNRLDLDITIPDEPNEDTLQIVDRFTRQPFMLAEITIEDTNPISPERFEIPAAARVPEWTKVMDIPIDSKMVLNARRGGKYGIEWLINGRPWTERESLRLKHGSMQRLQFVNESYRLHPMHIHGLFFKVIARNGTQVDEPHWRDTVLVYPQETIDVGVVPLDKGKWLTHCHIQEHAEAGMMSLVEVE
ncbi:MAG: multicopper oxidase family protein, partial [Verrucomicrobia bacterium]|nr:multicopper oxidase family protein [Verrucomicrobiota bacterium]